MKYFLWYVLAGLLAASVFDGGHGFYMPPVEYYGASSTPAPAPEAPAGNYKGKIWGSDPRVDYP